MKKKNSPQSSHYRNRTPFHTTNQCICHQWLQLHYPNPMSRCISPHLCDLTGNARPFSHTWMNEWMIQWEVTRFSCKNLPVIWGETDDSLRKIVKARKHIHNTEHAHQQELISAEVATFFQDFVKIHYDFEFLYKFMTHQTLPFTITELEWGPTFKLNIKLVHQSINFCFVFFFVFHKSCAITIQSSFLLIPTRSPTVKCTSFYIKPCIQIVIKTLLYSRKFMWFVNIHL